MGMLMIQMSADRLELCNAAADSYKKHFGNRATKMAKADLLGEAMESLRSLYEGGMEASREGRADGFAQSTTASKARIVLAKAKETPE